MASMVVSPDGTQRAQSTEPAAATAGPSTPPAFGRVPSTGDKLRCRVNEDAEELQLLHEVYGWVPGKAHVRPTPEVRAQKELLLANLSSMWASAADWVFHHVFELTDFVIRLGICNGKPPKCIQA